MSESLLASVNDLFILNSLLNIKVPLKNQQLTLCESIPLAHARLEIRPGSVQEP